MDYKLRYIADGATEEISFAPKGNFEFGRFSVSATVTGARHTVTVTAKSDAELLKCTK